MADEAGMFPQHPRSGDWETLKGRMLSPHEAAPLEAGNTGDPRFNGTSGALGWVKDTIVTTGMTGPGGTMAK